MVARKWEDLTPMLGPPLVRAEVVTAADMNADAAAKLAGNFHCQRIMPMSMKCLEKETLDIVSITTWQSVRAELTLIAAEAGVSGIIGEKPMSASYGEAQDMMNACDKAGPTCHRASTALYAPELRGTAAHSGRRNR